jgi:toluene monooxygenase system protein D
MLNDTTNTWDHVGPVLQAGALGNAIVAAIRDLNPDVVVVDRGAYLRVLAPRTCLLTRAGIEKHLGRQVRFPGELETVMSAFKGSIRLTQDEAVWQFQSGSRTAGGKE